MFDQTISIIDGVISLIYSRTIVEKKRLSNINCPIPYIIDCVFLNKKSYILITNYNYDYNYVSQILTIHKK